MTAYDLAFQASRISTPAGERAGFVGIRAGRIAEISATPLPATTQITLSDNEILLPGLVDTHVHVNDPGRAEWEGFATATRAAAAGGVTTLIDMPLNSIPPTTSTAALATKRSAANGIHVDVGFWAGAVPENLADLAELHHAGVFGFKAFTLHSGVDEFGHLTHHQLADAMHRVADLDALFIVHAENSGAITNATGRRYQNFLASRPHAAETTAIAQLLALAEETGARLHILHLSSAEALPAIRAAKQRGVRVSVETCPHYLTFTAEEIPDGATQFKCCPPIREAVNREHLWQGLADGTIDLVVTDHSPCTVALKRQDTGDFGQAWGGIAGLQIGLPAVWTAARRRGFTITDVTRWMAGNPADLVGLRTKGRIEPGAHADLSVFAPDEEFTVAAANLHHRNKITAYEGMRLNGVVRRTWLRGNEVTDRLTGTLLTRGDT